MIKTTKLFSILFTIILLSNSVFSQTTYYWNGSVSSNFSAAGNWTPFRQIGLVTDILVFENGSNLNVTNVYQVTVGQLIVRNNTNLTLSPATGNAKLLTIKGTDGEDLVVEQGSSLKVTSNDPALNFYIGAGATAEISGTITFDGSLAHYLNAADENAIKFKQGSKFIQQCPGSIFTTTGVSNAVVFDNGSEFRINHSGALDPFGVSAPSSKIKFESSSKLVISSLSNIHFSGRTISELVIEEGSNILINDFFNADLNIFYLTVKPGASFVINNTNSSYNLSVNISGNRNIEGNFTLNSLPLNKLNTNNTLNEEKQGSNLPADFSISQNYPNPFNPSTKIDFSIPVDSKVSIKVFDISGKEVSVITNSEMKAGFHTVNFNAGSLSSGIYFYTINTGSFTKTMKMVLVK